MINIKNNKGVTLIALVVTIIVLLILAGVSITSLVNENGIVVKGKLASEDSRGSSIEELKDIWEIDNESSEDNLSLEEFLDVLIDDKLLLTKEKDTILNSSPHRIKIGSRWIIFNEKLIDMPSTADTSPFIPSGAKPVRGTNLDNGLTIIDSNNNEWVWVEVPRSIYKDSLYNDGAEPANEKDYIKIESVLHNYTKDYRDSYAKDEWKPEIANAISESEYNSLKTKMLESVYLNGGFYVGKYETGKSTLSNGEPEIKRDLIPFNYIYNADAVELSKKLAISGRTCSPMFGVQWDLMLKHIENKKDKSFSELTSNSNSWGNYYDATFTINRGKYKEDYSGNFKDVVNSYDKNRSNVLLTTGATDRNSAMNIYDIVGNVWEFTLEVSMEEMNGFKPPFLVYRAGACESYWTNDYASKRKNTYCLNSGFQGFHASLY